MTNAKRMRPARRSGTAQYRLPKVGRALLWAPLLAALAGGCRADHRTDQPKGPAGPPPAVPVLTARVVAEDMPVEVRAIGWGEALATVTIKARVEGQLVGVHFAEGQDVSAGDLLFSIDPRPFEATVKLAEARLAQDRALAEDAEKNAEWVRGLYAGQTAGQRELDSSLANAAALRAAVQADEAALAKARLDVEYCAIKSPLDGRTGDLSAHRGTMIKANDTVLLSIEQVAPIYVALSVPEQHLGAIQEQLARGPLAVRAVLPGQESAPELGELAFVDNHVDSATGTIRLKGRFANAQRRLWPGQYVNATLTLRTEAGAVVVPSQAVQTGQKGTFVFVVKDDLSVELREVTVNRTQDGRSVISAGLSPEETVVTDGQLRLVPGVRVQRKEVAGAAEGAPT